jgi:hypothetical protein
MTITRKKGLFEDHVVLQDGWSETNCHFFINDKLLQVEKYHHLSADDPVDKIIFEPSALGKIVKISRCRHRGSFPL